MPFVNADGSPLILPATPPATQAVVPASGPVSLTEQVGAALLESNSVVAGYDWLTQPSFDSDAGFNPGDWLPENEQHLLPLVSGTESLSEMRHVKAQLMREEQTLQTIGEGPLNPFVAHLLAAVVDPVSWIPVVGPLSKGVAGARVLGRAGAAAAGTAAEVAISETILSATKYRDRTSEVAASMLFGALLGGTLGGAGALIAGRRAARAKQAATEDFAVGLKEADEPISLLAQGELFDIAKADPSEVDEYIGAMLRRNSPEDTELAGSFKVGEMAAQLSKVGLAAPSLEGLASRFPSARQMTLDLVDTGLITKGHMHGSVGGKMVELKIRGYQGIMAASAKEANIQFKAYRARAKKEGVPRRDRWDRARFYDEVGKAMSELDTAPLDPEVTKFARYMRESVFTPLKDEAVALKLLNEDVKPKGALSYFTRVWNTEKIAQKRYGVGGFHGIVAKHLRNTVDPNEIPNGEALDEMADAVIDRILRSEKGRIPFITIPSARGPLKERTFNIPDRMVQDFKINNVMEVAALYTKTMSSDIEFMRAFGKLDISEDIARAINTELKEMLKKTTDPKEIKKLRSEAKRSTAVLQSLTELVRGVQSRPTDSRFDGLVRMGQGMRTYQFLRNLGQVTISSVMDMGRVVQEGGLYRSFRTEFSALIHGLKSLKLAKHEANLAGTADEVVMGSRLRAMFDLDETYATGTRLERGLDRAGQLYGNATLLNYWNQFWKSQTSMMVSTRILKAVRSVADGKDISQFNVRRLAQAGIDKDMALRIAAESDNWDEIGHVITAGTERWADQEAVQAMRTALLRDVDHTIVTPGRGDAPVWTSSEWGKTLFQFKRFTSAATQRVLISGLQAKDMRAVNGICLLYTSPSPRDRTRSRMPSSA